MHKILPLLILILSSISLRAQISVASFTLLDSDPDARIHAVLDEEDIPGALIKVVTTAKGFNYDIGQLPVIKVDENHVGEIWVYVPDGTMKMKISHPDLGNLRGADVENGYFMFPQRLKRAKVYRMELTHQEVIKTVGPQIPAGITFNCDINGAEVFLEEGNNSTSIGHISNNQLKTTWPKGQTINYRIKKDRYEDLVGTYKVENDENTVDIKLKPLFGNVIINTLPDASIYLNENYVGKGSYNDNLDIGSYTVKVSREGYRDEQKTFNVASGDRKSIDMIPNMIYGSLNVTTTPAGADVYIDGKHMGKTPYNLNQIMVGSHKLEVKKSGYEDWQKNIRIEEGKTDYENIKLSDYGKIMINANIPRSSVFVNDRYMGTTPYNLSGPAGKYKIKVENGSEYGIFRKNLYLDAGSKNIYAKLHKILIKQWEFYGSFGYSYTDGSGFNFGMGFFLKNINIDFTGIKNDLFILNFALGYGLKFNYNMRITPQIGFSGRIDPSETYSSKNIFLGANYDLALLKWIKINLRPGYYIPVSNRELPLKGFGINTGISLFIGWGK